MATTRKDLRGRTLRKGEMQRSSDKRYAYSYTDPLGRRKYIYANDLVTLREKEARFTKDQMDGLDIYVAGKATVNFVFDRYMSLKTNLRQTTRSNYLYMYDRFIRDTFGKKKIAEIRYSDVLQFYNYLLDKQGLQTNTLESVHTLLHPTFQLAVRDEIVRKNPTDGVMAEIKKSSEQTTGVRHALTIPQQRAFMEHIANHCSRYCWEQAAALVKRWACAGMIWTMSGALSVSITVWSITRWAKAAILFCTSRNLKRKQAFGRSLCLIL